VRRRESGGGGRFKVPGLSEEVEGCGRGTTGGSDAWICYASTLLRTAEGTMSERFKSNGEERGSTVKCRGDCTH